jgi:hypothetical protein
MLRSSFWKTLIVCEELYLSCALVQEQEELLVKHFLLDKRGPSLKKFVENFL